jgi:hypothetical protein
MLLSKSDLDTLIELPTPNEAVVLKSSNFFFNGSGDLLHCTLLSIPIDEPRDKKLSKAEEERDIPTFSLCLKLSSRGKSSSILYTEEGEKEKEAFGETDKEKRVDVLVLY